MTYWAREDQLLANHIEGVAKSARVFADVFGVGGIAYATGLLHDLGKYTAAFQNYLRRRLAGESAVRGEVVHALQGVRYLIEKVVDPLIVDVMGNTVASHHGGLLDSIEEGGSALLGRIDKRNADLGYEEATRAFSPSLDVNGLRAELLGFCKQCQTTGVSPFFMLHLLTKILYSCLVDADRCDAAKISPEVEQADWPKLAMKLEQYLAVLSEPSEADELGCARNSISEQCKLAGSRPTGIYTLSVPTGGGKTLSSLRFALEHARAHGLKHIIYVIPYLSILDQTAAKLKTVLGDESENLIFEHHSNIEPPETNEDEARHDILAARWESPIILTTMVQFLESIYSNKASKLRKFHNMSEAVLVFDEIQALPIKCVHLFNDAVNFLSIFGHSTVLLCTATQPHLDKVERPVKLSENPSIANLSPDEMKAFERVQVKFMDSGALSHLQIAELASEQVRSGKSTLVILNTKSDARSVYEYCKTLETERTLAFLTTGLCPAHRLDVLNRLTGSLARKYPILCVSTQLIEAGVDISFGCVIRAKAGLDSIVQAAGRCNRNNEQPEALQTVFVVDVQDENLSRLPEIAEGKSQTARVVGESTGSNMLCADAIESFYKYFFYSQRNKMDFVIEWGKSGEPKSTVYSLLNSNPLGAQSYKDRTGIPYRGIPAVLRPHPKFFR